MDQQAKPNRAVIHPSQQAAIPRVQQLRGKKSAIDHRGLAAARQTAVMPSYPAGNRFVSCPFSF